MEESEKYERLKLGVTAAGFGADVLVLVCLLIFGWSFQIRGLAERMTASPWLVVMLYLAVVGGVWKIIKLPFAFYSGFVLEHKFGLSRQTLTGWIIDQLKALLIGLPVGLAAVELAYFFFRISPVRWWLYAGSIFVLFFVLVTNLAPVLVLPLFFKFKPIESSEFQHVVNRLTRKTHTTIRGIYEWSLGEKTRKANAAVVGWGNTRRIIVSDTLLRQFSTEEIEVIMAHELCHHVKNHVWQAMGFQAVLTYVGFFLTEHLLAFFSRSNGFTGLSDIANFPIFVLISMSLSLLVLPGVNYFSRRLETAADAYALDVTGDSLAFVSGMEKLAKLNLANASPNRIVEFIFYSHPSIEKRIRLAADRVNV